MMGALAFRATRVAWTPAILVHLQRGVPTRTFVRLAWPMVKSAGGEFGKVYSDSTGNFRWITVHPWGKEEEGVPVKIRESKTEKGTWHVVGGAGGKLNYLRLTNVKTPEEYRTQAAEKRKAKKEHEAAKETAERQRKAGLTEEQRQEETEAEHAAEEAKGKREEQQRKDEQEFIARVAKQQGWKDEEWQFKERAEKMRELGTSPERITQEEDRFHEQMLQKAKDAIARSKRAALSDPETAARLLGNDVPLHSDDPTQIALTDLLDGPETPTGKGFKQVTRKSSDEEVRRAIAADDARKRQLDLDLLDKRVNAASASGERDLEAEAQLKELQAQARVADLMDDMNARTPEQRTAEREAITKAIAAARDEQADAGRVMAEVQAKKLAPDSPEAQNASLTIATKEQEIDRLRDRLVDLAVIEGSAETAVKGEAALLARQRLELKKREIAKEHGQAAADRYEQRYQMMQRGAERYRRETRRLRESGAIKAPEVQVKPIDDAEELLQLLGAQKALEKRRRALGKKEAEPEDERLFGKPIFLEGGQVEPGILKQAQKDVEQAVETTATQAFLSRVESPELLLGRGGVFSEDYDRVALHRALDRHVSAGTYNVLNNAALAAFKTPLVKREVVDVLGAGGTAQLLAALVHKNQGSDVAKAMSHGLGEYHVKENVRRAEERIRELDESLDEADEAIAHLTTPDALVHAVAANQARAAKLEEARETMGQALGEYEATAALVQALGAAPVTEVHTNLGPIGSETAIRQLRALGLGRDDYEITSDGTNQFATIKASAFPKLAAAPDPERERITEEVLAIKRGERDEDDYQPKGAIVRTATSLNAQGVEPPSLTTNLKPFDQWGDPKGDVDEYIARRVGQGEDINDVLPDLLSGVNAVPEAQRAAAEARVRELFPPTESYTNAEGQQKQRLVKAEQWRSRAQQIVEEQAQKAGFGEFAPIHAQGIDTDNIHTHEAMFRALADDPRAMAAFKPVGELTDQEQRALRQYFAAEVASAGSQEKAVNERIAALGPEPQRTTTGGLFGGEVTSPEWLDWKRQRDRLMESLHFDGGSAPRTSAWQNYVTTMGGTARAYAALQDRLKSGFNQRFHRAYTSLTDEPLRLGVQDIRHAELHAGYLDPDERKRMLAEHKKLLDSVRNRATTGRYAEGSVAEKLERARQVEEIERQNQRGFLLGATAAAGTRREPKGHERYFLGDRLEAQIGALMPNVAHSFKPGEPIKLIPDKSYTGKYIHQQRTIKAFMAAKRLAVALGTGSGKTGIAINSLTEARGDPKTGVKRGLFLVPSAVQGQFGGEFARFADPKGFKWAANPGADHAQRVAEHKDANTHAVVHTHQGFRDDMVKLLADHWDVDHKAAVERFMKLDRKAAASAMREVWNKHGIDYQMMLVDEGHGLLDREGKPDSVLSRIAQATSDNTPYYMSASADPIKNDVTELRSLLSKLHPDGRYDDPGEWQRRYGVNTTAAAEALKREVAPWVYAATIPSGNQVNRHKETVPLTPWQQEQYDAVLKSQAKLAAARSKGTVDVEAAKTLAPHRFEKAPEEQHEAIAREIQRNPGTLREAALARIIEDAPRQHNAKIQALVKRLAGVDTKKQPHVIFAGRLKQVEETAEALAEAGHRVVTMTGADSAQERDKKRRAFQPDVGEPTADIFVLSNAGEAGLNLQRGQTLIQLDRPMTAKGHAQRNGRIDRLGQKHPEIDLVDLATDTPYEARAADRIQQKYALRDILTDPADLIDDTGLAGVFTRARRQAMAERNQPTKVAA
jgi:hypothetical protein